MRNRAWLISVLLMGALLAGCVTKGKDGDSQRPLTVRETVSAAISSRKLIQASSECLVAYLVEIQNTEPAEVEWEWGALTWPITREVAQIYSPADQSEADTMSAVQYEFRRKLPPSNVVERGHYDELLEQPPEVVEKMVEDLEEWAVTVRNAAGEEDVALLRVIKWHGKWWLLVL